jgi:hypothetical protein
VRKVIKLNILLLFFLFPFSPESSGIAVSYRIPEQEVREMETIDHELCLSKGHDLLDYYSARMYWKCRLRLVNSRIKYSRSLNGKNKFYIRELKRIRRVIKNYIEKSESSIISDEFGEKRDEDKVTLRKQDAYYYNLLRFFDYDFEVENLNSDVSEIDIINTEKSLIEGDKKAILRNKLEKYPSCAKFDLNAREFDRCIDFQISIDKCRQMVLTKIKEAENRDKFNCKKYSVEKYPDHLYLYNSEYMELMNRKKDEFRVDQSKEEAIERRLLELNKLMSGPRLSNVQLLNLRKFEENKCNMDKKLENNMLKMTLAEECERMIKEGEIK